jgi:hypothetical protein
MVRKLSVWTGLLAAVTAASALAGCSMCQAPYDYSSPVIDGTVSSTTPPGGRAGSAISGGAPVMTVADDMAVTE